MPLRRTPHTFIHNAIADDVAADKSVETPTYTLVGTTSKGQITTMTPAEAWDAFGVEVKRPHVLLCSVAKAQAIGLGDEIIYDSREFRVVAMPLIRDAAQRTNHGKVLLEERDVLRTP